VGSKLQQPHRQSLPKARVAARFGQNQVGPGNRVPVSRLTRSLRFARSEPEARPSLQIFPVHCLPPEMGAIPPWWLHLHSVLSDAAANGLNSNAKTATATTAFRSGPLVLM